MQFSRFFVLRPIFTTMITMIVIILGAISLNRLPIDLMPDITYPTLNVNTNYESAAPEEMEELITRPIEEAMSAVPGVEEVSSSSSEGSSTVRITFAWGTDLDAAANDIRDRLDRVLDRLPENATRPTLRKFDPSAFPILIMGAYGHFDLLEMQELIDDKIKNRIERIPGVASLDIWGGLIKEIHVNFLPDKIKALKISLDSIIRRIDAANMDIAGGTVEKGDKDLVVRTPGQFKNLDDIRNTIVANTKESVIKLGDIATVEVSNQKVSRIIRMNGKPGIRVGVRKQSGTNTVDVAQRVLKEIEKINQEYPQLHLTPIIDTSDYIKRSIFNVTNSAMYGGILAIFVLLLFLRNIPSTIIISTSIPISIIATFALMYFNGFTLNIMTLGGLALGVGMMVDCSIVVLENIYRLRETGLNDEHAAIKGSEEVTAAIVAGTLTTLVVFLPLVFMRGMSGIMFKQLAYIVSFALLCSLLVSLTLIPMLSARIHRIKSISTNNGQQNFLYRFSHRFFLQMEAYYLNALNWALENKKTIIISGLALVVGSVMLIPLIGVEFMPATDESEVRINVEMEAGTRLDVLDAKTRPIEELVAQAIPEKKDVMSTLGRSFRGGTSATGEIRIALVPKSQRNRSSDEIAVSLRKMLSKIPGATIRARAGQGLFILRMTSSGGDEKIQIDVLGYDFAKSNEIAQQIKTAAEQVEGVTDVVLSREEGVPEELIIVDREKAADLKLTVADIASTLQTILQGSIAGYFRESGNEYAIRVKLKDGEKLPIREILDISTINALGEPIVLRNVIKLQSGTGPMQIDRKNQERVVSISVNISGRDMGHIISDISEKLRQIPVPHDFTVSFAGDVEEQQKAFRELLLSLILSLILVYMVMACLYESLRDPFVVMFSVPLAVIGVTFMLFLTNTTFNVQSYIGCIMLGGIVVNNAILLVDQTNLLRRSEGFQLREAIVEAGRRRLRPILMTTLTTLFGLAPLALGMGEGGEAQAPLARAVIGGLFSSTLITLVFIPALYMLIEEKEKFFSWGKKNENNG